MRNLFKKTMYALSVLMLVFAFTACEEDKKSTDVTEGASAQAVAILYGNQGDGIDEAIINVVPNTATFEDDKYVGTGEVFQFYITYAETEKIAAGTYPVTVFNGEITEDVAIAGFDAGHGNNIGCMIIDVEADTVRLITGGSVTIGIEGDVYTINATVTAGEDQEPFSYEGSMIFVDNKPKGLEDLVFTDAVITYGFGDAWEIGSDVVILEMETEGGAQYLKAYLTVPTGTTSNFAHSYSVFNFSDPKDWGFTPGGYDEDEGYIPSYIFSDLREDGYYKVHYLVGGTIDITETGVTLNGLDQLGNPLTGSAQSYTIEALPAAPAKSTSPEYGVKKKFVFTDLNARIPR